MGRLSVIQREGRLLLEPFDQTVTGVWISSSPVDTLPQSATDAELGRVLLATLQHSKRAVPHPDPKEWPGLTKELYKAAGVRSWKALIRGATCCSVSKVGEKLRFLPTENVGHREGFQGFDELAFNIPATSSHEVIGQAVRRALELAK